MNQFKWIERNLAVHYTEESLPPLAALSRRLKLPFLWIWRPSTCGQGTGKGSILYSDRLNGQIPIDNTSAWQLLDYLTLISLPPSIHSNHWLHFSIYFTINASGPTEQSSDESKAQSRPCRCLSKGVSDCVCASVCACATKCVLCNTQKCIIQTTNHSHPDRSSSVGFLAFNSEKMGTEGKVKNVLKKAEIQD